jgi:hypothetical protein
MPWKEINVMSQKLEFVLKTFKMEKSFTELCTEYGISTKTGYKWKERFFEEGIEGLKERTRKPHHSPTHLPEEVICEIIRIKKTKLHWGPKKYVKSMLITTPMREFPPEVLLRDYCKKLVLLSPENVAGKLIPRGSRTGSFHKSRMTFGPWISRDGGIPKSARNANR